MISRGIGSDLFSNGLFNGWRVGSRVGQEIGLTSAPLPVYPFSATHPYLHRHPPSPWPSPPAGGEGTQSLPASSAVVYPPRGSTEPSIRGEKPYFKRGALPCQAFRLKWYQFGTLLTFAHCDFAHCDCAQSDFVHFEFVRFDLAHFDLDHFDLDHFDLDHFDLDHFETLPTSILSPHSTVRVELPCYGSAR